MQTAQYFSKVYYSLEGNITEHIAPESRKIDPNVPKIQSFLLCNNTSLCHDGWEIQGSPRSPTLTTIEFKTMELPPSKGEGREANGSRR